MNGSTTMQPTWTGQRRKRLSRRTQYTSDSLGPVSSGSISTTPRYYVPWTEQVHMQFVMAVMLVYLLLVGFVMYNSYSIEREDTIRILSAKKAPKKSPKKKNGTTKEKLVTNMKKHAAEGVSVSRPKVDVAKMNDGVSISQPGSKTDPDYQSKTFKAIRDSMDGVGNVVPVEVDGTNIDHMVVQTAIEDNKDFYPRVDQMHAYQPSLQQFDSTQARQDEMFSPIPPTPFGFG